MLIQDQIIALRAPFPKEALSPDTSRGFELTSIKAAFVIERLNEVFGLCGAGWRYIHSPFEQMDGEVITEVALQYPVEGSAAAAVVWDEEGRNWAFLPNTSDWSWPIFACGGKKLGKGGAPLTDARKSAVTDGLTKAASMIGVGHEVFKGLVRVGDKKPNSQRQRPSAPKPTEASVPSIQEKPVTEAPEKKEPAVGAVEEVSAPAYWKLANEALKMGISHGRVRHIAQSANGEGWAGAMALLREEMKQTA